MLGCSGCGVAEACTRVDGAARVEGTAHDAGSPAAVEAACAERRAHIERLFTDLGRCTRDADCVEVTPGCPFGCSRPVNRAADPREVLDAIRSYRRACRRCHYRCVDRGRKVACVAGRCVLGDEPPRTPAAPAAP